MRNKNLSIESQGVPASTRYRRTRYKTCMVDTSTAYKTINIESRHVNTEMSEPRYMVRKRYPSSVCAKKTRTEVSTDAVGSVKSVPRKQSYIQGWNAMLQSKVKESPPRKQFAPLRVCLPTLTQNTDSEFTLLDPVTLPIDFIQRNIQSVSRELPKVSEEVTEIRKQLNQMAEKVKAELISVDNHSRLSLSMLKNMLITDRVQSQQHILKARRMVKEATSECQKLKLQIENTKTPVSRLQEEFFKGRPFDLQMQPDLQSEAPSSYF